MRQIPLPAPDLGGGRANLVLAGFSATGKSGAGRLVAERLGVPLVDLDQIAERQLGGSLAEVFASSGEARFRELEAELLREAAALSGTVIATGGGAVLHREFAKLAAGAVVVVLTAAPQEIERRLSLDRSTRPLLAGASGNQIRDLLGERARAYAAAGLGLDTDRRSLAEVAALVLDRYRAEAGELEQPVTVRGSAGPYPVWVGAGTLDQLDSLLSPQRRVLVVSDLAVASSAGARVEEVLGKAGREVVSERVGRGEGSKQIATVVKLWDRFQALRLDRGDLVVAVGGGAALDAIGFAAATWARGTPWVTVPTTILAMVDASIGGKVAIDRGGAKNAVGAFHHPLAVVCDPTVLKTLPDGTARPGLAEVVKSAVLASPLVLDVLEQSPSVGDRLSPQLAWLIEQVVRIKAGYVGADPEDDGLRQSLNLGHTFAHGIEAASDYRIAHGRAVAIGLVAAARLGTELGITPEELSGRLETVLGQLEILGPVPDLDRARVGAALLGDKKRRGDVAAFVLPAAGGAVLVSGIELERALAALWGVISGIGIGAQVSAAEPAPGSLGGDWPSQ